MAGINPQADGVSNSADVVRAVWEKVTKRKEGVSMPTREATEQCYCEIGGPMHPKCPVHGRHEPAPPSSEGVRGDTRKFMPIITKEQAMESAQRLINSHFGNPNPARCSIPASPNDDDLVVMAYIESQPSPLNSLSTRFEIEAEQEANDYEPSEEDKEFSVLMMKYCGDDFRMHAGFQRGWLAREQAKPANSLSPREPTDDELVKIAYDIFGSGSFQGLLREKMKDGIEIAVPTMNYRALMRKLLAKGSPSEGTGESAEQAWSRLIEDASVLICYACHNARIDVKKLGIGTPAVLVGKKWKHGEDVVCYATKIRDLKYAPPVAPTREGSEEVSNMIVECGRCSGSGYMEACFECSYCGGCGTVVVESPEPDDNLDERLAILSEELGEAQQAIGKILRHGYDSHNPNLETEEERAPTNREELEKELGDVVFAINLLGEDIEHREIGRRVLLKQEKIKPYLHHQK